MQAIGWLVVAVVALVLLAALFAFIRRRCRRGRVIATGGKT